MLHDGVRPPDAHLLDETLVWRLELILLILLGALWQKAEVNAEA